MRAPSHSRGLGYGFVGLLVTLAAVLGGCSSSSSAPVDSGLVDANGADAKRDSSATDAHRETSPPSDAGSDAIQDSGHAPGLTCGGLLGCDQACTSGTCTNGCYAQSTGVAQGLFNSFTNCLNAQCPGADASSCDTQAATGACASELVACSTDTFVGPSDPDGGGVVVVPTDAGKPLNCGEYIACAAACTVDGGTCATTCVSESTPEARALAAVLNSCLAMACPSTDGGPCASAGPSCSGCIEQVELAEPDTCATPYIACNGDTSNDPDGGAGPKVLLDGGVLTTVVSGLDQAASTIIAGGGYLYYTQVISGSPVLRLDLQDGGTVSTLGPPLPTPVSLALDESNVYAWSVGSFALNSSINNKDGTVVQVPLNGGAPITLAQNIEVLYDAAYLNAIAIDSTHVYWVAGANGGDGAIMRTPIGTASPVAIYSNQFVPQALTTDGVNVYWADWGPFNAAGDPMNEGTIWQGPVAGGTPVMLASGLSAPSAIVVDANTVYWSNLGPLGADNLPAANSGSVMKVPIGGGAIVTIASAQAVPVAVIASGSNLYWSQYGLSAPGLIMTVPLTGGTVSPIAAGLDDPAALAVYGSTLFWTNANSSPTKGSISALTPY